MVLALAVPLAAPASAASRPTPFCAAVHAFTVYRPPTRATTVAALDRLGKASPAQVRNALRVISRAVKRGDPSLVFVQAAGSQNFPSPTLSAAGQVVISAAAQSCHLAVNFLNAVPTNISAQRADPTVWAQTVCTSLSSWGQDLKNSGATLLTPLSGITTTLPEVRNGLFQFVSGAVFRTQELVNQLNVAGTPDTPDGGNFAGIVHDGVTATLQTFVGALPVTQALPNDPQGFQVDAQALVQRLDDAGRSVAAVVQTAESQTNLPALRRVFSSEPSCAGIG